MQSSLRARAYLAENPAAQPSPVDAAERILDLLEGVRATSDIYVNLAVGGDEV